MSLESVIEYVSEYNMDHRVMVLENSTATVEQAAHAHGVDPDQIRKTLAFKIDEIPILIVVAGDRNSSIRLTIEELEKYSNCKEWVDVCKPQEMYVF